MAHFILEYSDNVDANVLAIPELFASLHDCAVATGLFPLKGIRSRAHRCSDYRVADGNPRHMFAHLTFLVGTGRTLAEREKAAKALFAVYAGHFEQCFQQRGVALSFEMRELEPVTKYNKNNIAEYL